MAQQKVSNPIGFFWFVSLVLFLGCFNLSSSQTIVKTLPGYNGTLPFTLETGYIAVGEDGSSQLFYYFVESDRDPANDPILLWHTGGPGCSGFYSLVYEHIGPFSLADKEFAKGLPSLVLNPFSWTKVVNVIFLDSPVGTGFSYSTTTDNYTTSDTEVAIGAYEFLQKWMLKHPSYLQNRLYIGGDSFGGKVVPLLATHVSRGNKAGVMPLMNLKGYVIGNPSVGIEEDNAERVPYAHRLGLISDQYYKLAESSCKGEYDRPDPRNYVCINILEIIEKCINNINQRNILEPNCAMEATGPDMQGDSANIRLPSEGMDSVCQDDEYASATFWANNPSVQEALQIGQEKTHWVRCNKGISCTHDVLSAFPYHLYLSQNNYEALVYSGDHDMGVPYLSTLKWIQKLNLNLSDNWRPWFVTGQVAGYTEKYQGDTFSVTFATLKGAGHTAPEYKPRECFNLIDRWFSGKSI